MDKKTPKDAKSQRQRFIETATETGVGRRGRLSGDRLPLRLLAARNADGKNKK